MFTCIRANNFNLLCLCKWVLHKTGVTGNRASDNVRKRTKLKFHFPSSPSTSLSGSNKRLMPIFGLLYTDLCVHNAIDDSVSKCICILLEIPWWTFVHIDWCAMCICRRWLGLLLTVMQFIYGLFRCLDAFGWIWLLTVMHAMLSMPA